MFIIAIQLSQRYTKSASSVTAPLCHSSGHDEYREASIIIYAAYPDKLAALCKLYASGMLANENSSLLSAQVDPAI